MMVRAARDNRANHRCQREARSVLRLDGDEEIRDRVCVAGVRVCDRSDGDSTDRASDGEPAARG
jgi:hypothetical protein